MIVSKIILGIAFTIVPQSGFPFFGNTGVGAYDSHSDRIYIASDAPKVYLKKYVLHELGHRIWYKELSSVDRYKYCRYWRSSKRKNNPYGKRDCVEAYAESYAKWRFGYEIDNTKYFK